MNAETAIDPSKTVMVFSLYHWSRRSCSPSRSWSNWPRNVLQSVTSIQEPTLSFAPKLVALAGVSILLAPWLIRSLIEFTEQMIGRIGTLGH